MKIIQAGSYPVNSSIMKGGVEASIFGTTKELAKTNEVAVISFPRNEIKRDYIQKKDGENIVVYYLKNPSRYRLLGFCRFKKIIDILKKETGDIVHIHECSIIAFFLILYLRLKNKRFVLTEHGILHIEYWQAFKRDKSVSAFLGFILFALIEFLCLNLSKKIIVDTDYVKQKLKGITFRRLAVIPQGIDYSFYKLNDNPQETTIVSIGSISHRKGYEYSIKAIDLVKKQIPNIRYEIIGVLQDDCKLYYEKLLQFVYDNNLKNNITFHVNISDEELRRILESANVFILHSAEESQGIVFCEAMAVKKPIVTTNVGGIPHVVQNNINGLLSKFGDTTIFANNIMEIIKDKQLRKNMSNQSYRLSQSYNWTNIIKKIVALYVE